MGHLVINHYPAHMSILDGNTYIRIANWHHWFLKDDETSKEYRKILSKRSWAIIRVTCVTIVISLYYKEIF